MLVDFAININKMILSVVYLLQDDTKVTINTQFQTQQSLFLRKYSKTCLKRPLPKRAKIDFQDQL